MHTSPPQLTFSDSSPRPNSKISFVSFDDLASIHSSAGLSGTPGPRFSGLGFRVSGLDDHGSIQSITEADAACIELRLKARDSVLNLGDETFRLQDLEAGVLCFRPRIWGLGSGIRCRGLTVSPKRNNGTACGIKAQAYYPVLHSRSRFTHPRVERFFDSLNGATHRLPETHPPFFRILFGIPGLGFRGWGVGFRV